MEQCLWNTITTDIPRLEINITPLYLVSVSHLHWFGHRFSPAVQLNFISSRRFRIAFMFRFPLSSRSVVVYYTQCKTLCKTFNTEYEWFFASGTPWYFVLSFRFIIPLQCWSFEILNLTVFVWITSWIFLIYSVFRHFVIIEVL